MVTAVGLDAPSACAAIRCAINGAQETGFVDRDGEPLQGCEVEPEEHLRGIEKLIRMGASAISECQKAALPRKAADLPILLCVAEPSRPGRPDGLEEELFGPLHEALNLAPHADSRILPLGRVGIVHALRQAEVLLYDKGAAGCIVAGVDSFLYGRTIAAYEEKDRLLTSGNSNGFIPGEAGAAVLLGRPSTQGQKDLRCVGTGLGQEKASIDSEEPLRADGLVQAFRECFADSGCTYEDVQYRLADVSGEQYVMKEAQLAIGRTLRGKMKPRFDLWHPADCVGEVGAAIGPCILGVALAASRKSYAPGPGVLCHFGNDAGERGGLILKYVEAAA
jgi:3-oxoacyl-[acyl-carrier-protein] synthase-1